MTHFRSSVIFAVLVIAMASLPLIPSARTSKAATPRMYIALGDSIAAGVGSSLPRERSYPALVSKWTQQGNEPLVLFENLAIPGETAATFLSNGQLQQLRDIAARAKTAGIPITAVTVTLGGNEMLDISAAGTSERQAALDAFRQNFAAVLDAVKSEVGPEAIIAVTTYYDLTGGDPNLVETDAWWIARFNTVIRELAAERQVNVAEILPLFQDRIEDYTHYPSDVHPTNEGHMAIARAVWSALAIDQKPPVVEVLSPDTATRRTPTLRFRVHDSTGVGSVDVRDKRVIAGPLEIRKDEYVVLLDLADADGHTLTIAIDVSDVAGHSTRHEVMIRTDFSNEDG